LGGNQGLTIKTNNPADFTGSYYGVLNLDLGLGAGAPTLTGGIRLEDRTRLVVNAGLDPSNSSLVRNPLGGNEVTLAGGSQLFINGGSTTNGLSGRVFATNGTGNSSRVDFTGQATSVRYDTQLNNVNNIEAANGAQWVGKVNIGTAGAYTFFASADDGARIYIDGVLVLNNDGGKGNTDLSSAPIFLAAGQHDIRIDYVNGSSGGNINLGYAGPSTGNVRTVISPADLRVADVNTVDGSSSALQLLNDVHLTGNAQINLSSETNSASSVQMGRLQLGHGVSPSPGPPTMVKTAKSMWVANGAGFGKDPAFWRPPRPAPPSLATAPAARGR